MRVDAFQYELPEELIAQRPEEDRERARLMVVRPDGPPEHRVIAELPELLPPGALVVVNDTRVIPARLLGKKRDTRGRVEILLLSRSQNAHAIPDLPSSAQTWQALGKSSKPLRPGAIVEFFSPDPGDPPARPLVREALPPPIVRETSARLLVRILGDAGDGLLEVAIWSPIGEAIEDALRTCGRVPLPPYIARGDEPEDAIRYQTVYARNDGAVAAPTAGLHLTTGLLDRMSARGCEIANVTLHVGLGTFRPVRDDDLDRHPMHAERYVIPHGTAEAFAHARARDASVVAIGTTTARALESAAVDERRLRVIEAETRLLIQPGHSWRAVDLLLTNFHLPRSTLLALVCAFSGIDRVLAAYRLAVRDRYRFFSYGDAMLLWRAS